MGVTLRVCALQLLSSADPNAWAAVPPFEGSKVKTVLVGAEAVFKARYVPGETSKAIILDVEGLQVRQHTAASF